MFDNDGNFVETVDSVWEWQAVAYASLQPRGNAHWESIIELMMKDIERYLAYMDIARYE